MAKMRPSKSDKRIKQKQKIFIDAFVNSFCSVSKACRVVGMNRDTYYEWVRKYDDFEEKIKIAINSKCGDILDMAESVLIQTLVKSKDPDGTPSKKAINAAKFLISNVKRPPELTKRITDIADGGQNILVLRDAEQEALFGPNAMNTINVESFEKDDNDS